MPKIVDHVARREELAAALWRVIAREGLEGASVRAVAAEANWSAGAVRHYFASQDDLLNFGIDLQLQRIPARVVEHLRDAPGPERAARVLGELLPLDETRLGEARVWFAALTSARGHALREIKAQGFAGERAVCRVAVLDVLGRDGAADAWTPLEPALEIEVEKLHAAIDGLCINAAAQPDLLPPARVQTLLASLLDDLRTRLSGFAQAS